MPIPTKYGAIVELNPLIAAIVLFGVILAFLMVYFLVPEEKGVKTKIASRILDYRSF